MIIRTDKFDKARRINELCRSVFGAETDQERREKIGACVNKCPEKEKGDVVQIYIPVRFEWWRY